MQLEFNANKRDGQGTGASRRLRRTGRVPGILYGGPAAPQQIDIDHNELFQLLRKEAFYSSLAAGQSIHVSQLPLPKGVEIVHHGEGDPVVANIVMKGGPAAEEPEVAPTAVAPAAAAKPERKAERVDKR